MFSWGSTQEQLQNKLQDLHIFSNLGTPQDLRNLL